MNYLPSTESSLHTGNPPGVAAPSLARRTCLAALTRSARLLQLVYSDSTSTPRHPAVRVSGERMVSSATRHYAEYVSFHCGWQVDYLPGRHLSAGQARAAIQIAAAPHHADVARWAAELGMTEAEARGYATARTLADLAARSKATPAVRDAGPDPVLRAPRTADDRRPALRVWPAVRDAAIAVHGPGITYPRSAGSAVSA